MAEISEAAQVYNMISETMLVTLFRNSTPKALITLDTHFWAGRPLTNIPKTISPNNANISLQRGTLPAGVKYGVCYADGEDSTARKWIVAFDSQAQKAYAEAGPTGPVDWNVVEVKLDRYSGNSSEVVDNILGGKCSAQINGVFASGTFS